MEYRLKSEVTLWFDEVAEHRAAVAAVHGSSRLC